MTDERQQQESATIDGAIRILRRSSWFAIVAVDKEQVTILPDGTEIPAISQIVHHDSGTSLDTLQAFLEVAETLLGNMAKKCVSHREKLAAGAAGLPPTPWGG